MKQDINSQKLIAIGLLVTALLFINAWVSFSNIQRMYVDTGWVVHTHQVTETVNKILSLITAAESQERGYLITNDPAYLESYILVPSAISKQFQILGNLITDNPAQIARINVLKTCVANSLKVMNDNLYVGKEKSLVRRNAMLYAGNNAMEKVVQQAEEMTGTENDLLVRRTQRFNNVYNTFLLTTLLENLITFMVFAAFCFLMRLYLINRDKTIEELASQCQLEADLKESQNRFRQLSEDLLKSNKELEEFAFIASHDLKEPLMMIKTFADFLSRRAADKLEKKERDYLDSIKEAALQGQSLIKDLLEFCRVGKEEEAPEKWVDLDETIKSVKTNLKMLIEESDVSIVCNGSLPQVKCTPMEMRQLFQNLVENAIKYRGLESLRITISAVESKNNRLLFAVGDNGIGISPENRERIFKIFERIRSDSKTSGTGIGLAICRRIVENYGGKIWVESKVGHGSIFYFTLPCGSPKIFSDC